MERVNPKLYSKYTTLNKQGKKILYVRLQKAVCGTLKAALLFYQKLVKQLQRAGFKLNPYGPCVCNKLLGGKQMTIVWHMDDLKYRTLTQTPSPGW